MYGNGSAFFFFFFSMPEMNSLVTQHSVLTEKVAEKTDERKIKNETIATKAT